jgi:DNA-binding transcriptional LysR family regulator
VSSIADTSVHGGSDCARNGDRLTNGCPELREFRYFVAAAEELHFTRASQRLHIAQQALSASIRQLEVRLGTILFERTTRRVRLTSAGEALLPAARETLAAAEQAVVAARDGAAGIVGRLNVGVSQPAHRFGGRVVLAMRSQAPRVAVDVRIDFVQPLVEALAAGELDAAFLFCPEQRANLCYQRVTDQQAVAAMRTDHVLAERSVLHMEDLCEAVVVLARPETSRGYNAAVLSLCRREGVSPRTVEATGYIAPPASPPHELVGITTEAALDAVHLATETARVPLEGCTLPFDLVWNLERDSALLETLRSVTRGVAAAEHWPLSRGLGAR